VSLLHVGRELGGGGLEAGLLLALTLALIWLHFTLLRLFESGLAPMHPEPEQGGGR
jgi:hypothetical protein